jgi:hypothetical protein
LDIPGLAPAFYRFDGTGAGSPRWAAMLTTGPDSGSIFLHFISMSR